MQGLVHVGLDASGDLLLLGTVASSNLGGLGEVGADSLHYRSTAWSPVTKVATYLGGEVFERGGLNNVDGELVVGVNGSKSSTN